MYRWWLYLFLAGGYTCFHTGVYWYDGGVSGAGFINGSVVLGIAVSYLVICFGVSFLGELKSGEEERRLASSIVKTS